MNFPGGELFRRAGGRLSDRAIPSDVVAVIAFVAVADVGLLAPGLSLPLRAVLALPLLFFLPGYAVVTALFPARAGRGAERYRIAPGGVGDRSRRPSRRSTDGGGTPLGPPTRASVTVAERAVLGFATSLAVLPVVALGLSATGVGFTLHGEVAALSLLAVGGVLVGWGRRLSLPEDRRFRLPVRDWASSFRWRLARSSPLGTAATVALAVAALVAASTLGYALVVPGPSAGYTEQSLLTEGENGRLVAGGYPSAVAPGETAEVVAAVGNHEGETVTYTLVARLQRVRTGSDDLQVVESRTVDRAALTVDDGDRGTATLSIAPEVEGEDLRLVVLLYRGSPPEDPGTDSAYRNTYIWIDVGAGAGEGSAGTDAGRVTR